MFPELISGWPWPLGLTVAAALVPAACLAAAAGSGTEGRKSPDTEATAMGDLYARAERVADQRLARLVHGGRVEAHWLPGGTRFWYASEQRDGRQFTLVDATAGTRSAAFDHRRLAASLGKALGQSLDPRRLPFDTIEFDAERKALLVQAGGGHWQLDLRTYACTERPPRPGPQPGGSAVPEPPWEPVVRAHNLYLMSKTDHREVALVEDGDAQRTWQAFYWSPDGRWLIACRTTPGDAARMPVIESRPADRLRPQLHWYPYALPGDAVDVHELWVFDAAAGRSRPAAVDRIEWGGPPRPFWRPDNRHFLFEQTARACTRRRVIEVDAATGESRTLIDERTDTCLPPHQHYLHYLNQGEQLLWTSERNGWRHLYLFDGHTGELLRQLTAGPWCVRRVERVDEVGRTVDVAGGGREPDQDPYLIHVYRVGLDDGRIIQLTPGHGDHEVQYSPDGRYLVDTYSRVDQAPTVELRRGADGGLVCGLERADISELEAMGWRPPEPFVAKGRDGQTDIWGVVFRPSDFDPGRRYPVIEFIYAGPHGAFVPKRFAAASNVRALAELGFIVVQIDGMGTSFRSKAFRDVSYRNLADSGFPDRIAWLRALAARDASVDLERVGIYGYSAGGYSAARALIAHHDFYHVAVAIAGNHDHRTDKLWWNELWMGYPVGENYREQSNVENAARVRGKLLLMHGEDDRNVNPFASTQQFVQALVTAQRDFDMLFCPAQGHNFRNPYWQRRIWDYFVRHLGGREPPANYRMKTPTGDECTITMRNRCDQPVIIYWIGFAGERRQYHRLAPGAEARQHTFDGHEWEAWLDGAPVSRYTASPADPVWEVTAREAPE